MDVAQPVERERQLEALRLRLAGASYEVIADRLGYADKSGPFRAVQAVLNRQESHAAEELRAIEDARLDALLLAHWSAALRGDVKAAEFVGKLHDRRVKLHGLAAPQRVRVEGVSQEAFTTSLREDLQELGLPSRMDTPLDDSDREGWANT
ncbi:hypothetical protein [Nocardia cyriacigeorgica]|uniref:hypothetical protein n=1 Tax=Nocardia cyriacigeorgica TaxID=135487 RepID=UPI002458CCF6|nr:hypothetical protein [Nocardia cyriacigeorgica]